MQFFNQIPSQLYPVIFTWIIATKGLSLWFAARRNQKIWFIVLFLINTVIGSTYGLLEAFYLIFIAKIFNKQKEDTQKISQAETPQLPKLRRK